MAAHRGRGGAGAAGRQSHRGQAPVLSIDRLVFGFVLFLTLIGLDAQGQTRDLPDFKSLMKAAGPAGGESIPAGKAPTPAAPRDAGSAPRPGGAQHAGTEVLPPVSAD